VEPAILWSFAGAIALIGAMMWYVPVLKGADAFFGIPVSEEYFHGPRARRYLLQYRLALLAIAGGGVAGMAAASLARPPHADLMLLLFVAALLAPSVVLVGFWYAVRPHEERVSASEAMPSAPAEARAASKWMYVNPTVQAVSTVGVLIAIALTIWRYPDLPQRIPAHWNIAGQADGWVHKSPGYMVALLGLVTVFQLFWIWLLRGLAAAPVRLPSERAAEYLAARERYMRLWAHWLQLLQLGMLLTFGGIVWASLFGIEQQARGAAPPGMIALYVGTGVLLLSLPWLIVETMRRRRAMRDIAGPGTLERLTPTEGWIAGVFYYNRDDPTVWVEKRVGIGWTLNMARWQSWLFLAIILGLPIAFTIALVVTGH
jgi:uncharacterized membrane protein